MSVQTICKCEGPGCEVTAPAEGGKSPLEWIRLSLRLKAGLPETLDFHDETCAAAYFLARAGLQASPRGSVVLSLEDAEAIHNVLCKAPASSFEYKSYNALLLSINAAQAVVAMAAEPAECRRCAGTGIFQEQCVRCKGSGRKEG